MMASGLTSEQDGRLISNLLKWARILDENAKALSSFPENLTTLFNTYDFSNLTQEQFRAVRTAVFSAPATAHMVAISLRQMDEYARELQHSQMWKGEIAVRGAEFRDLFASEDIRNLRDVVEHSAEYIAGKGRKPELVLEPEADWPSCQITNGKVTVLGMFGRAYEVKRVILAAIAFAKTLPSKGASESTTEQSAAPA